MALFRQAFSVAQKDLAIELRTKESLNAAGAFAVVILLLFSFAFDPSPEMTQEISGGLLWLVFLFAGALIFNRGFARELPNECLDALMASPLSSAALLLGKARGVEHCISAHHLGNRYRWCSFRCSDRKSSAAGIDAASHCVSASDSAADFGDRIDKHCPVRSAVWRRSVYVGKNSGGVRHCVHGVVFTAS